MRIDLTFRGKKYYSSLKLAEDFIPEHQKLKLDLYQELSGEVLELYTKLIAIQDGDTVDYFSREPMYHDFLMCLTNILSKEDLQDKNLYAYYWTTTLEPIFLEYGLVEAVHFTPWIRVFRKVNYDDQRDWIFFTVTMMGSNGVITFQNSYQELIEHLVFIFDELAEKHAEQEDKIREVIDMFN